MANTSANFIKINNEYVKFYATTNSSLPEILRNTGALIVVQNGNENNLNEDGDLLRSLYLANNFIAEGHGFSAYSVRDYYDSYASIDANGKRQLTNILDKLNKGITDNAYNIENYYVKIDGGDITNTIIYAYVQGSTNTAELSTKYLTNLLKPADYEDLYIHDVMSYIEYDYTDICDEQYNNIQKNHYISYATNLDELDFNDRSLVRNIRYDVPRGAEITCAYISLKTDNNSCAGFNASVAEDNSSEIPNTETSIFVSRLETLNSNRYRFAYNNISSKELQNTAYFSAHTLGTVNYKNYPNLPEGVKYISYENVIDEYTTILGYVDVNLYDTIRYCGFDDDSDNVNISYIYYNGTNSRIYDTDNLYSYATICGVIGSYGMGIAIPDNYDAVRIIQRRGYESSNNRTTYYEYDVSGDTYELMDKSIYTYMCIISHGAINDTTGNTILEKHKNYYLNNEIQENDSVIVLLRKNSNQHNDDFINIANFNDFDNDFGYTSTIKTSYFIQSSEYNSTHWFAPEDLGYIQNTI